MLLTIRLDTLFPLHSTRRSSDQGEIPTGAFGASKVVGDFPYALELLTAAGFGLYAGALDLAKPSRPGRENLVCDAGGDALAPHSTRLLVRLRE